ncbi:MAG: apolipoprotein N-acyltransferase [Candidatus Omnitrophota bacterium]
MIRSFVYSLKPKDYFLCIISAIFLALPYCNGNLWIFAWFGFVPVFLALNNKSRKEAFFLFFIAGLVFWSTTIYWLIHVTLPGTILLIIYLALYPALFGLIIRPSTRCYTPLALIFIPSVWVLLEYIRSYLFSGFGWALLGYSQYLNLPVIQVADITGVWGVSFLVMMINVAIYQLATGRKKFLIPLLVLGLALGYGYYKIYRPATSDQQPSTSISIIQGNIPQELKWDTDPRVKYHVIDTYLTLSSQALKDNPALIIWPEASLPVVLEEEPYFSQVVGDFARQRKVAILTGAVTSRDNLYFNSAVLFSKEGELSERYEKVHLVPFGEYIPLKDALPFLQAVVPIGEITPGEQYTVFMYNGQRFSVLICFEDLFPEIARRYAKNGAGFLVNITNDAWYKKTPAAYQHLQASVLRAVETRLSLVRAANTGVSGFIRPSGKIISPVSDEAGREIFVPGYRTQPVFASGGELTLYTRYGDIFILFCIIALFCGVVVSFLPSAPCVSPHR